MEELISAIDSIAYELKAIKKELQDIRSVEPKETVVNKDKANAIIILEGMEERLRKLNKSPIDDIVDFDNTEKLSEIYQMALSFAVDCLKNH